MARRRHRPRNTPRRLEEEGRWHGLAVHGRRDGGAVHVLASTTLLTDSSGRPAGAISVNRAATEESVGRDETRPIRRCTRRSAAPSPTTSSSSTTSRSFASTTAHRSEPRRSSRWNHPTKGLLLPAAFIQAAEQSGLIGQLGEIVLEKACAQAQLWRDEGLDLYLSVNMSARQLADELLADPSRRHHDPDRHASPDSCGSRSPRLHSWRISTKHARRSARSTNSEFAFRSTTSGPDGRASPYLRELPVHALKIDRLFVNGLGNQSSDLAIVKSILALGRELGLDVIAEGIETLDQRAMLCELGCETGQGYFFGRPTPPDELLDTWRGDHRLAVTPA